MRKISSYLVALFVFASITFLTTGCGEDAEDPIAPLPEATGTVKISFAPNSNFTIANAGAGDATVTASTGDKLTVSVVMEKSPGGTKPQTLRIWEATQVNTRGTLVEKIDLKKSLDIQKKTVEYEIKQTNGLVYLYFEVDETGSKFSRRLLTINVGAAGSISTFTNITLGAQGNAAPSRLASGSGDIYSACELIENIGFVDIVYLVTPKDAPVTPRFLSNKRIGFYGFSTSFMAGATTACSGETIDVSGGLNTYFKELPTTTDWAGITTEDKLVAAAAVTTADSQDVAIDVTNAKKYYAFINGNGKKGIIKVNSLNMVNGNYSQGTVNIDVKVQR